MLHTIDEMLAALKQHPDVRGIIEFGSNHRARAYAIGDCDLFVVLSHPIPVVSSLHFHVGDVPVDLNLTTLDQLEHLDAADRFRWTALREGEPLYAPSGKVAQALEALQQQKASSHALSSYLFGAD